MGNGFQRCLQRLAHSRSLDRLSGHSEHPPPSRSSGIRHRVGSSGVLPPSQRFSVLCSLIPKAPSQDRLHNLQNGLRAEGDAGLHVRDVETVTVKRWMVHRVLGARLPGVHPRTRAHFRPRGALSTPPLDAQKSSLSCGHETVRCPGLRNSAPEAFGDRVRRSDRLWFLPFPAALPPERSRGVPLSSGHRVGHRRGLHRGLSCCAVWAARLLFHGVSGLVSGSPAKQIYR